MTRILYVDDETLYRDASKQFLQLAGYTIEDVSSGREALDSLYHTHYDAIVSDYYMPGMTGIEFLKIVRAEIGDIPFILFTGKGREEVVIEAIENGADFYVQKGGNPAPLFADLTHKITLAINRRESDIVFRKNEERLRKAEEIGKTGCWEYVPGTRKIWGSKEALRIFGLHQPPGEVSLDIIETCILDKERVYQALHNLIDHEYEYNLEFSILPVDGSSQKVIFSVAHLENTSSESVKRIFGIIQDVTEKKDLEWKLSQKNADLSAALEEITATEEELKQQLEEIRSAHQDLIESERKYRKLFEENSVGIALHEIICDESGAPCDYRFIDLNPAFEQLTGLSAHDVIGRTVLEVLPGTESYWIESYGRVACSGKSFHGEQFSRELNKSFEVTAYAPSPGQFVTIIQDITKRKESEVRLIELNAYLENLISHANVPIIVWDSDLKITRINRSFERLIGLSSGDVTGRPLSILFPYDRVDQCMRLIRTTHTGVQWETVEIPISHWDGSVRIVIWNSATIYSADGKTPIATIDQGRDITDEKLLEKEKAKAMVQIQGNIAQLAILNDGIRNPLTIISMYADMIGDQKVTQGILDEVTKVDEMIRNLDLQWVNSTKILDHLRRQNLIAADFSPSISSCVDDTSCLQDTCPGFLSHQKTIQGQYIEEIQAQLYTILDSIDAQVYVIDMETHAILYINEKGRAQFGNVLGQKCYTHIHDMQSDPCPFCTNHLLVDEHGPTGVYRWEFHNQRTGTWLDCRDRAIRWTDGRIVRLEIATNITDRKQAEEALTREGQRLENIIEGTRAGTWEWNVQTGETVFNERWVGMVGYTLDELSPVNIRTWEILVHPDDLPLAKELLKQHISGDKPYYDCELRMKHKDGHWVWVHDRGRVLTRTADGKPLVMFGTHTDITDRKRAEEELYKKAEDLHAAYEEISATDEELRQNLDDIRRSEQALHESEEKYRTVFENTGTATVVLEENGIISLANNRFIQMSGFSKGDIEGKKKWVDFVIPEDLQRMKIQNQLRMQNEAKALSHYEFRFVTKTSDVCDISLTIGVVPGTKKSIASLMDITEWKRSEGELHKKAEDLHAAYEEMSTKEEELRQNLDDLRRSEQALHESEKKYRSVIENIQDTYYRSDCKGNLILVSPSGAALLGYDSVDDILGKPIAQSLYHNSEDRMAFLSKLDSTGSVRDYETQLQKKDGTPIFVSTTSHYVYDEHGMVAGVEGIIRDITDLKSVEYLLLESERVNATMIGNIPGFVYRCANDTNRTMEFISDGCLAITGFTPEDLIHNKSLAYSDLVHPDFLKSLKDVIVGFLEKKKVFEVEYPLITKTGEIRRVCERGRGIFSPDGRLLYLEGFISDVTRYRPEEKASGDNDE